MEPVVRFLFMAVTAPLLLHIVKARTEVDIDPAIIREVFTFPPSGTYSSPVVTTQETGSAEKEEQSCQCVPYYLCQIDGEESGIIDIRIKDAPCENYLDVCCQKSNVVNEPITPKPKPRTECGHRNAEGVGFRITGASDSEAQFGEFPWMVAVLRLVDENPERSYDYHCGGALIHPQVVLTAAHRLVTVKDPSLLKVRVGEWDMQTEHELYSHQDKIAKKIVIHPKYYAGALYNDIALIFLETPVEHAENIDFVCLPPQGAVFDHSRCFATGWGKDSHASGTEDPYQVILKKVDLPVVPRDMCIEALRKTRLGPYFKLHESFICAGGAEGKDTCKGDGGGPLVCPDAKDPTRYQQAGIVAWGIGCGENNTPGVYTNVAMFRDWIDEQVASQGHNPRLFDS